MARAISRWLRPVFASGSVHMGFVVGEVALEQVFFRFLRFSSENIIPPWLFIHLHYPDDEQCSKWAGICGFIPYRNRFLFLHFIPTLFVSFTFDGMSLFRF
jgi:hypothetical protein